MEFTRTPAGEKRITMSAKEYLELLQWALSDDDYDDEGAPVDIGWLVDMVDEVSNTPIPDSPVAPASDTTNN